ncbi:hypothetical protein E2562_019508 [Oryza meyeriana var. granulata]|uniref:Uncharacterized protein n=1 Tax=Oryza meyeriana var. granulata TaxID=110450 RepID=A0A6G1CFX5_9ORYZ|nr:hypothetical protein E2562_019508 [Oryza meyeriana var. granulata]
MDRSALCSPRRGAAAAVRPTGRPQLFRLVTWEIASSCSRLHLHVVAVGSRDAMQVYCCSPPWTPCSDSQRLTSHFLCLPVPLSDLLLPGSLVRLEV